jgi:hypothetical protein
MINVVKHGVFATARVVFACAHNCTVDAKKKRSKSFLLYFRHMNVPKEKFLLQTTVLLQRCDLRLPVPF